MLSIGSTESCHGGPRTFRALAVRQGNDEYALTKAGLTLESGCCWIYSWKSRPHLSLARHQHSIVGHVITRAFRVSGSWSPNVTSGSWPLSPKTKAKAAGSIRPQEHNLDTLMYSSYPSPTRWNRQYTQWTSLDLMFFFKGWRNNRNNRNKNRNKSIRFFLWVIPLQTHKRDNTLADCWCMYGLLYQIMLLCQLCAGWSRIEVESRSKVVELQYRALAQPCKTLWGSTDFGGPHVKSSAIGFQCESVALMSYAPCDS